MAAADKTSLNSALASVTFQPSSSSLQSTNVAGGSTSQSLARLHEFKGDDPTGSTDFLLGDYVRISGTFYMCNVASETVADPSTIPSNTNFRRFAFSDNPVFTGNPTAPTPAANDNDTSLATTAYVQTELGAEPPNLYYAIADTSVAGTGNAIEVTTGHSLTAYVNGLEVFFYANNNNTGSATIDVDSIGSRAIRKSNGIGDSVLLVGGEITDNDPVKVVYNTEANSFFLGVGRAGSASFRNVGNAQHQIPALESGGTFNAARIPASIARLASPALTGNPTAPTPAADDNDTSIATTAYVQTEIAGLSSGGATNLGIDNRDTDSLDVTSSTGTDAEIPSATTSLAGLQSAADKTKLDGIAVGATANTGDITAVNTGNNSGLAGGDSDGAVNLRLDFENLAMFGTVNFSDDDDIVPLYNDDNGAAVGVTLGQFKAEIGAGAATTPPVVLATNTEVRFRHTSDLDSDNIYAGDGEIEFSQALDSGDDNAVIYIDGTIETVLSGSAPSFADSTGDAQSWTVGTAITDIVVPEASGDPTPTYAVVGLLPAGLDFDTATRTISGTPSAVGSGTIIIRAINSKGTANWSIDYATTAPSGITRETIPTKSGEVVRALITVGEATVQGNNGSGKWYSRHGSENIGSVAGSLAITGGLTISRVWSPGGNEDDDFRLNQQGGDSLAEWVWGADNLTNGRFEEGDTASPPFGAGYDKAVFLSFDSGGTTQMIELGFRDDFRNTGAAGTTSNLVMLRMP